MMRVVYALDNGYLAPTAVSLATLLREASGALEITIMGVGLSAASFTTLEAIASRRPQTQFRRIEAPESFLRDRRIAEKAKPNLSKLLLPKLMAGRVLFIDGDTIVRKDVRPLYEVSLEKGRLIAAAPNMGAMKRIFTVQHAPRLLFRRRMQKAQKSLEHLREAVGLLDLRRYVNTGVMVMDLDAIREDVELLKRATDYEAASHFSEPTQMWLARTLGDRIQLVDQEWNIYARGASSMISFIPRPERLAYRKAVYDPAIVHFVGGGSKPWKADFSSWISRAKSDWRHEWRRAAERLYTETGIDVLSHQAEVK